MKQVPNMASQPGAALRLFLLISGLRAGLLQPGKLCATKEYLEGLLPENEAHINKPGKLFATKESIEGLLPENYGHINKPGRSSSLYGSAENFALPDPFYDQIQSSGERQNLETENVTVVEGEVATISCRVKNNDDSVIQLLNPNRQTIYFRDFRPLKDARFQLMNFSRNELRVSLTNVSIHDEGRYFCQLYTDPPQEAYTTITVLIPPNNLVIEVPKDTYVEGEEVEMNCTAMASKPAAVIRWFKGTQEIPGMKTDVEVLDNKMFRVRSQISFTVAREDDDVPFVCLVDHPAVKDLETRQYIEVQWKLFATKEYIEGLLPENCGHINKPGTPRKLEYFVHDEVPPFLYNSMLLILCSIMSLNYKPQVMVSVNNPQGLTREGEPLELTCRVSGKPRSFRLHAQKGRALTPSIPQYPYAHPPAFPCSGWKPNLNMDFWFEYEAVLDLTIRPENVQWRRLDEDLPELATVVGDKLFITSLNKTDNGTYRCEASNSVGSAFADYILYVYDPPTTPPPPTTTTTTTTTSTPSTIPDASATTEPAVHDTRAGEESPLGVDHAVIGGVVAVVVFAMLCLLIILGRYFARHKGTYFTHEAKGADDAADADTAIINAEGGQNNCEEKKEYFI